MKYKYLKDSNEYHFKTKGGDKVTVSYCDITSDDEVGTLLPREQKLAMYLQRKLINKRKKKEREPIDAEYTWRRDEALRQLYSAGRTDYSDLERRAREYADGLRRYGYIASEDSSIRDATSGVGQPSSSIWRRMLGDGED